MQIIELEGLLALHRRAVVGSVAVVGRCDDLTVPTPCRGWQLSDLLAHMTVQHRGFARAVAGEVTTVEEWDPVPLAEPVRDYVSAAAEVLGTFAAARDPQAPVTLPEVRTAPVPAQTAIGFHLLDYVVHAWDVAVSVGADVPIDQDVVRVAVAVGRQIPDGLNREAPDASFAHALPVPADADPLDELLLLTGRDPAWRAG